VVREHLVGREGMDFAGFLRHEDAVDLGEVGGHRNLRLHILRGAVEHTLPKGKKELSVTMQACFDNGPYVAA
jgi:hypothetical protein